MVYEKSKNTKDEIVLAFSKVINKKQSLDKVRVNDILEEAKISRSTFYNHFKDTDAIVAKIFIDLIRTFIKEIDKIFERKDQNIEENIKAITNVLDKNKTVYRASINSINVPEFMDKLKSYVLRHIYNNISKYKINIEQEKLIELTIVVNGSIDIIIDYFKSRVDCEAEVIYSTIVKQVKGLNIF